MDLVVRLNKYGCSLFILGELDESQLSFSFALRAFHLVAQELEGTYRLDVSNLISFDHDVQSAFDIEKSWEHFAKRALERAHKLKRWPTIDGPAGPADELSLYVQNEPFTIEVSGNGGQDCPIHLIAASLLFNSALLYQKRWSTKSPSRSLNESVSLYAMAAQALLCQDYSFNWSLETVRRSEMLQISILNNSGYAYYQMQRYDSSRYCFGILENRLLQLGPPHSSHEHDLRMRFAINVFVFYHCAKTPTAAAA